MFCENCGRKSKTGEVYCADCGSKLKVNAINPQALPNTTSNGPVKKKSYTGLIIGIVVGVFVFIAIGVIALVVFAFSVVSNYGKEEYIEIGSDNIPSIYKVLGVKKLVSYNRKSEINNASISLSYDMDDFNDEDIIEYRDALLDEDFYKVKNTVSNIELVKESESSNYVIIVNIVANGIENTLDITYIKESGSLNSYNLEIAEQTKQIGDNTYGYINIPESWIKYESSEKSNGIEYINTDKTSVISLNTVKNTEYKVSDYISYYADQYEQDGAVVNIGNDTIDGNSAYTLTSAYQDGWISKEWMFIDKNNNLYYVYIGTYDKDDTLFNYIDTYKKGD